MIVTGAPTIIRESWGSVKTFEFGHKKMGKEQSMKWIELKGSSPVQIHEPPILIQSNPADDLEAESSPVQSENNKVDIYQIGTYLAKSTSKNKRRCVLVKI